MTNNLLATYLAIDQSLYENIPNISVAEIILRKSVYDIVLNRDVPSILTPCLSSISIIKEKETLDNTSNSNTLCKK